MLQSPVHRCRHDEWEHEFAFFIFSRHGEKSRWRKIVVPWKHFLPIVLKIKEFWNFVLSFIMSSWDLLFFRTTSSHVSWNTEVGDVPANTDYIRIIKTILAGGYISYLFFYFQMRPWCYNINNKMWSKLHSSSRLVAIHCFHDTVENRRKKNVVFFMNYALYRF